MVEAVSFFVAAFAALFVVVEPFGVVPTFAALTAGRSRVEIAAIARRASLAGAVVLVAFTLLGQGLLSMLDIDLDAFRAAGGLLLLLTALEMLRGRGVACRCSPAEAAGSASSPDIAIVPIAVPLLSGPGSMATVMVLASRTDAGAFTTPLVIVAIVLVFALSYLVLRGATLLQRVLGDSAMSVVQRVLGLVLAAMSIQLVVDGVGHLWG